MHRWQRVVSCVAQLDSNTICDPVADDCLLRFHVGGVQPAVQIPQYLASLE
jgi:hypothetical protein